MRSEKIGAFTEEGWEDVKNTPVEWEKGFGMYASISYDDEIYIIGLLFLFFFTFNTQRGGGPIMDHASLKFYREKTQ